MIRKNRKLALCGALIILSTVSSSAQAWWSCPSGYEFQLKNNNTKVRCYKPYKEYKKGLKSCPKVKVLNQWVGSFYKVDYFRNKGDACTSKDPLGVVTIAVPHSFCSNGYKHEKRSGKDRCIKKVAAKEIPPSRNVR